jgi:hypothetical protein
MRHVAEALWSISLADGATIEVTAEHPFWIAGTGWRPARLLAAGDPLWGRGGVVAIAGVVERPAASEVWNLEVDDLHAFSVGAGAVLVHNKAMPADPVRHGLIAAGAEWTYRSGGTSRLEADLVRAGGIVHKAADPATGLRTLTFELPGQDPIVLRERGRYADVRIDVASLPAAEQTAMNDLFHRYGITDPVIQGRILEAIEAARIVETGRTPPTLTEAIRRVRPLLDAARAEGTAGGATRTTQEVLAARGNVPLAEAQTLALVPEAQQLIDAGILSDPIFLRARTVGEARGVLAERLLAQTVSGRAAALGRTGGRVFTRIQFLGNLYDTATTGVLHVSPREGRPRPGTDVIPDLDAAYIVERGGQYYVEYIGSLKVTSPRQAARARADARWENELAERAIRAGSTRFERTEVAGGAVVGPPLFAEVAEIVGIDSTTGARVDLTGRLHWNATGRVETIGAPGSTGFDAQLVGRTEEAHLTRLANLIWRLRELQARPQLAVPPSTP